VTVSLQPPLHLLRTFDAAARHQSYTRAAAELMVTQSAVSQQVRQLERILGRPLFERVGRGVRLTDQGRALAADVHTGLQRIEKGLAPFRVRSADHHLVVRVNTTFSMRWLMPRIGSFLDANESVELELTSSYWAEPLVSTGSAIQIDFGVVPPGAEEWPDQPLLAVAHPDVADRIKSAGDLGAATLLDVRGGEGWRECLAELDVVLDPWPRTHTSMTYLHTIELARAGYGVAIAHRPVVEDLVAAGQLTTVAGIEVEGSERYYVETDAVDDLNSAALAFLRWIRAEGHW
jgi:DNA-binding transcriptional LysR family regulator